MFAEVEFGAFYPEHCITVVIIDNNDFVLLKLIWLRLNLWMHA